MKLHFDSKIDWVDNLFDGEKKEMKVVDWQCLHEHYHLQPYNHSQINKKVNTLFADAFVQKKSGIFEHVLGECKDPSKLEVRIFDEATKRTVYQEQTNKALINGTSNCPYCAQLDNEKEKTKIWEIEDMDADHITAWSKGGCTDISNCQMLCKTHNRSKGNR